MDSRILGLRVAAVIFGLFCLGQLLRLVIGPEVLVAGHLVPAWPSAAAVVIFAALCAWMWTLSRTGAGMKL